MWAGRVGIGLVVVGLVSGCAGQRQSQQLARMQSQVGLLDERVAQLERAGVAGGSVTGTPDATTGFSSTFEANAAAARPQGAMPATTAAKPAGRASTRDIQQALKHAGFYQGSVDGKMGPKTRQAVREFQRVHGLQDDGKVGKQTWAKLSPYVDMSAGAATTGTATK